MATPNYLNDLTKRYGSYYKQMQAQKPAVPPTAPVQAPGTPAPAPQPVTKPAVQPVPGDIQNNWIKKMIEQKALAGQPLSEPSPEKLSYYNQVKAGAGAQKGWGVGYASDNISGGFNAYHSPEAMQTEVSRMQTVINNRKSAGMSTVAEENYLKNLQAQNAPYAPVDFDKYKTEEATIEDIAKKYGFDFSRDYAKRQAEAEAQARRNANQDSQRRNEANRDLNMKAIDNNLMDMADGLDRNYFQQYMQQAQGQVENGLNAGIAADQDLRLAMARQAEMGGAYRDANLGRMQENQRFTLDDLRLAEEMGLIDQQSLAREDSLFNERLQMGFDNAMQLNNFRQTENLALLDNAMKQREQNLQQNQFTRDINFKDKWNSVQQNWNEKQFKNMSATDKARLEWEKHMYNNLSAADKAQNQLAHAQLAEQKRQFGSEEEWRRYQYNNMSAADKARLKADVDSQGRELAWRKWETEYTARMALNQAMAAGGSYNGLPSGGMGPQGYNGGGLSFNSNFLMP